MHRPGWTDKNEHDPGLTLLALFAWLALGFLLFRRFAAALRRERVCRNQ